MKSATGELVGMPLSAYIAAAGKEAGAGVEGKGLAGRQMMKATIAIAKSATAAAYSLYVYRVFTKTFYLIIVNAAIGTRYAS
jgi:hypothetical protein